MDKERLPQWGWLLLGLFAVAVLSNVANFAILEPIGLPEEYFVVTLIAAMSLVVIYVGIWYDDDRASYWDRPRAGIAGDVVFVLLVAGTASAIVTAVGLDRGFPPAFARDLVAMIAGFLSAWATFYFRNTELYDFGS